MLPKECIECGEKLHRRNRASSKLSGVGAVGHEDVCADCYHRAGLENEHADSGHEKPVEDCPACEAEARAAAKKAAEAKRRKEARAAKQAAEKARKENPDPLREEEGTPSEKPTGIEASKVKARGLLKVAKTLGWSMKNWEEDAKTGVFRLNLVQADNEEAITAFWKNGVWQHPCTYTHGARSLRLRNASAAKKRMASKPDVVTRRFRKGGGDSAKDAERAGRVIARSIPFDPENTNLAEVTKAVLGKKIIWRNSITEAIEEARVMTDPKQKHLKLESGTAGRPILTFAASGEGFRSVALESILQVTR